MEKDIPCKWKSKQSWSSNSHIRKIDFKIKTVTRQRRTLHNDQGINPRRRYNNCKYLCTQHSSTSIHKANPNSHKREFNSNTIIVGDFNTPLSPMDRLSKMKIYKETEALNDTLNKMDSSDIYRTFHPKQQNTRSSQVLMEHSPE